MDELFNARDKDAIRRLALTGMGGEDKRIWRYNNKGIYTVKSAYRYAMNTLIDTEQYKIPGDWMLIWKLNIPQRVKIFLWRIARGCLPTRDRLQNKGVHCTDLCSHCETTYENEWHLFVSCSKAQEVWMEANLWDDVSRFAATASCIRSFIFAALGAIAEPKKGDFVMMLWCLWKCRNDKIWEDKVQPVQVAIQLARDVLHQWQNVRQKEDVAGHQNSNNNNMRWQPPPQGEVKCNVDAALFNEQYKFGVGMCIRDDHGMFVKARTKWFHGSPPPVEAEAWALKEAITWMGELELSRVVIELDCLLVVNAMKDHSNNQYEFGTIISNCRRMLGNYPNFKISFVKRQANFVAHSLARSSKSYASSHTFDLIPSCISTTLMNEII